MSDQSKEILRVAIIGQSSFAAEVYKRIKANGHEIVGIFTVPDKGGKEDAVAAEAKRDGIDVFKYKTWRRKGTIIDFTCNY